MGRAVGRGLRALGRQRARTLLSRSGSLRAPGGRFLRAPLLGGRGLPLLTGRRGRRGRQLLLLLGPPGRAPGLTAGRRRGGRLPARRDRVGRGTRHARQQGLAAVGGQHDAFSRGARRGLLTLSALRHRDSYPWGTLWIVGSRYRVPGARCHAAQDLTSCPVSAVTKPDHLTLFMSPLPLRSRVTRTFTRDHPKCSPPASCRRVRTTTGILITPRHRVLTPLRAEPCAHRTPAPPAPPGTAPAAAGSPPGTRRPGGT